MIKDLLPAGGDSLPRHQDQEKLSQRRTKLVQKLDLRAGFAVAAKRLGISCENDLQVFKKEALKYAKMCGDSHLHLYNTFLQSPLSTERNKI